MKNKKERKKAVVAVVMGSKSDAETVKPCLDILAEFGVRYELNVLSAHRQPKALAAYVDKAQAGGVKVFIAAAGQAAALPGVIAAQSTLPVIGIPVETRSLKGLDSLLSIVQMPGGVPVACMAIGKGGAKNAAILALEILALSDKKIAKTLLVYKRKLAGSAKRK
ncbi:MAG: 5-(carboxyamino)imidazole ribonucleotide mutase [Candidatus Omnitrophica bacterium]|nr:5-(carboxyamino)imidazole ribonucleotide mutase [Candidatus Omnitrophota bacterium]MBU1871640.1 5-(carboxyamino)imidazole ribonucleotide mutase [Candidatus Omnitrophota bacterium]